MDISSPHSGSNADEPKPQDAAAAADQSSESKGPPETQEGPENEELTKVLAYGPAQRGPETPDVPEIKAHQTPESSAAPEVKAEKEPDIVSAPEPAPEKDKALGSALVPFIARQQDEPVADPSDARPRFSRFEAIRSRGMQAALVAAGVGIAWAFAGSFFSGSGAKIASPQSASLDGDTTHHQAAVLTDMGETRRLSEDIRALKKELDGLRASVAQNPAPEELRALKKSVDAVRGGLETTKTEMGSSLAQLSAKLDRAQHDPGKLHEISDRLDHLEHTTQLTTASIVPPAQEVAAKAPQAPQPPAKTASGPALQTVAAKSSPAQAAVATPAPASEKPQLIANWVVRDVYDGIALVEGPHGSIEVIEGETIPGAGTVKSIERRGSGWIVVTSRGLVDSARN